MNWSENIRQKKKLKVGRRLLGRSVSRSYPTITTRTSKMKLRNGKEYELVVVVGDYLTSECWIRKYPDTLAKYNFPPKVDCFQCGKMVRHTFQTCAACQKPFCLQCAELIEIHGLCDACDALCSICNKIILDHGPKMSCPQCSTSICNYCTDVVCSCCHDDFCLDCAKQIEATASASQNVTNACTSRCHHG